MPQKARKDTERGQINQSVLVSAKFNFRDVWFGPEKVILFV